jgi:hypothetical protein
MRWLPVLAASCSTKAQVVSSVVPQAAEYSENLVSGKQLGMIVIGAAIVAVLSVLVLRALGVTNPGVIGGGVAGGVCGALGAYFATRTGPRSRA